MPPGISLDDFSQLVVDPAYRAKQLCVDHEVECIKGEGSFKSLYLLERERSDVGVGAYLGKDNARERR